MSTANEFPLLRPSIHPCNTTSRLEGIDPTVDAVKAPSAPSKAAQICNRILRASSIRKRIFAHLGAFDVAKLIHATNIHSLLDAKEKQHFLNPLRDIFTDTELVVIRDMVKNGDILTIWGYELKRLFQRVRRVASYTSEDDSKRTSHLWMGGGSLIPVSLPGEWDKSNIHNNVRYPLQYKTNTPDSKLSIGQVDWEFVSCDIKSDVEMGVKVDLADLLDETMTGIFRPRRFKPKNMPYINMSRGGKQLKYSRFSERKSVTFDTGVNLRLSLYDSGIDHGKEEIFGSYKLRLGTRG
jgi:hypothetical protein